MFAVGHLSLGYLLAKASAKLLKQEINLPLIFLFSLIPDIDIIIPGVEHRTVTHSIIVAIVVFLPFFTLYKTKTVPYFIALVQHSLIGDFITGGTYTQGTKILWPITSNSYGLPILVFSMTNIILEWSSFLIAGAVMLKTKDMQKLLKGQVSHLSLFVPTLTVLLPSFVHFPLAVPPELLIPHITYLILFTFSIANVLKSALSRPDQRKDHVNNSAIKPLRFG